MANKSFKISSSGEYYVKAVHTADVSGTSVTVNSNTVEVSEMEFVLDIANLNMTDKYNLHIIGKLNVANIIPDTTVYVVPCIPEGNVGDVITLTLTTVGSVTVNVIAGKSSYDIDLHVNSEIIKTGNASLKRGLYILSRESSGKYRILQSLGLITTNFTLSVDRYSGQFFLRCNGVTHLQSNPTAVKPISSYKLYTSLLVLKEKVSADTLVISDTFFQNDDGIKLIYDGLIGGTDDGAWIISGAENVEPLILIAGFPAEGVIYYPEKLSAPVLTYNASTAELEWNEVEGAQKYEVYKDDVKIADVSADGSVSYADGYGPDDLDII